MMMGNGIMSDLADFSVPWHDVDYVSSLDLGYYSHSAQKLVSPVVFDVSGNIENLDTGIVALTTEQRTAIAGMIFQMFNRKWTKLWSLYSLSYSPINNYYMDEAETVDRDITRSGSDTGSVTTTNSGTVSDSGTNTGTVTTVTDNDTTNTGTSNHSMSDGGTLTTVKDNDKTNTGTQSNSGSSDTENGIFGFNSSVAVGSDTSENTNSNTRTDNLASTEDETVTETRATTHTDNRTDNLASTEDETVTETRNLADSNTKTLNTTDLETRNLSNSGTESDDVSRELHRSGSTGIYSPQQLITDEIELWQWNFYKQVFEDIDSILCLDIY